MFDDTILLNLVLVGLAVLLSGPIALAIVLVQRGRIADLEVRLARYERLNVPPTGAPEPAPARSRSAVLEPTAAAPPIPRTATVPPIRPQPEAAGAASARRSFEERFGTRWTVWIGGLALAVGAVLLVRYSVESGLFGPGMRVTSGFALAFGLLAAGEALRRRLRGADPVPPLWPDIPAMVTAAGTVALFGAIYAAYGLYRFIGPELAFIGLGATGLAAIVAALLHGRSLAGIGLVGALLTPLIAGRSGGSPWPLTLYLPLVAGTAYAFAWTKGWRALAVAAGIGAGLWAVVLMLAAGSESGAAAAFVHAMLQAALAVAAFGILPHRGEGAALRPDGFTTGALAAVAGILVVVLGLSGGLGYPLAWSGAVLAAILLPALAALAAPASAAGLGLGGLALLAAIPLWPPAFGPDAAWPFWTGTQNPEWLVACATLSAVALAAIGALRLLGGSRLPMPSAFLYAAGATLAPLGALALGYVRLTQGAVAPHFAAGAGALALGFAILAGAFGREAQRSASPILTLGLGVFASAAVAALALGLVFAASGGTLTVAMALAALGTAFVARRLDIRALRWCVAGLGLVVAARLAWDPTVVGLDLGTTPILNWLLVGYGLPALAFGLAAQLVRLPDEKPDAPPLIAQALALVFAGLLVFFEIRHALHGGDLFAPETSLTEQGLTAFAALGFALVLVRLDRVHGSPVIRVGSLAFGALAFLQSALGLGLAANPALTDEPVAGWPVLNEIGLAYGFPALAALALARVARATRPAWYVRSAALLALALGFLGLSLIIRHAFQGPELGLDRTTSQGEWYAYSAGWLALGLGALAYGVLRGSLSARLASAALVGLSIVKVFLFDLAGLDGPLRALSFLGLGVVLIGIGLVYQRFVFAPRARTD